MVEHKYQGDIKIAPQDMPIPVSDDPSPKTPSPKPKFIEMYTAPGRMMPGASKYNTPDPAPDMVEHPPHYNKGGFELSDVIEAFELPYHLGTVAKYVFRCQFKGETPLEDLRKAEWHLKRQIELEEKKNAQC